MSDTKVVYSLRIVEDRFDEHGQRSLTGIYKIQLGRRGTPHDMANELRMAADALEARFKEVEA